MSETAEVSARAIQAESTPTQWDWVDRTVWTERMLAALGNGVKGNKWFSLIDKVYRPTTLQAAWEQVKSNRGAAGVDGQSIERFAAQAERYLNELAQDLEEGRYHPHPVRRVEISKVGGKTRPLGIPTVKDRIVQAAVKRVIEPIFEKEFLMELLAIPLGNQKTVAKWLVMPMSYGFRPGRGCKDALREVDKYLKEGYTHVVDADLKGYFDSIPHTRLKERIEERISDGSLLELLAGWLRQDIVKELERWTPTEGTPQGAVISPLLANLYLHPLDETMLRLGYRMVRYADDFVILCQSAEQAHTALEEVKAWVETNGLTLHPDKTHVGDCRIEWQGFKDRIREKTRRTGGVSLTQIIDDLTPMVRGWYGYFKHACRWEFPKLDGFIRRRLWAILRKQEKRPGLGKCHADHSRWPNVYFAAWGLFTMTEARMSASQSR